MQQKKIERVLVCGAGTMGAGIAQTAATAGFEVFLYDLNDSALAQAQEKLEMHLGKMVVKGKISETEKQSIGKRIRPVSNFNNCNPDLVIEAIVEKIEIKTSLFHELIRCTATDTIFASNTSSLSLTSIANQLPAEKRSLVIGLHFFNPAPLMKLVEIVHTEFSSEQTRLLTDQFARACGKTPVHCKDSPGFIVNRVARPFYIETLRICEETGASPEVLDNCLRAAGFRMGPFQLMDLVGNDVNYAVSQSVYDQLDKPERLRPSKLQAEKVAGGKLGRKTGEGFYQYSKENNQP